MMWVWCTTLYFLPRMEKLLSEGLESRTVAVAGSLAKTSTKSISGRTVLQAMGLKQGDRVVVGNKLGTLRCGVMKTDYKECKVSVAVSIEEKEAKM